MKKGLNLKDHLGWHWIVSATVYFIVILFMKGFYTIETIEHSTWVWCLIGFTLFGYIEVSGAFAKRDIARAKDDMKFWMDKAIERQVQIDELRAFKK